MNLGLEKHYILFFMNKGSVILPNLKITKCGKFFVNPEIIASFENKGFIKKTYQNKFPLYVWKITQKGIDKLNEWNESHPVAF